jgi:single-strand DNA-binding protein
MATTTLIGNTTSDFELRFTQAGKAVANVTIAVSERKFDRQANEWVDGDTWFARCSVWGKDAENAAGSILKGTRVIAVGRIVQRAWEDKEGNKRSSVEVLLDEVGPSTKYATVQVTRAESSRGTGGAPARQNASQGEPWTANAPSPQDGTQDAWSNPGSYGDGAPDEVPF